MYIFGSLSQRIISMPTRIELWCLAYLSPQSDEPRAYQNFLHTSCMRLRDHWQLLILVVIKGKFNLPFHRGHSRKEQVYAVCSPFFSPSPSSPPPSPLSRSTGPSDARGRGIRIRDSVNGWVGWSMQLTAKNGTLRSDDEQCVYNWA